MSDAARRTFVVDQKVALSDELKTYYDRQLFCDLTLTSVDTNNNEKYAVNCHKVVACAKSAYLNKKLISPSGRNTHADTIELPAMDKNALRRVVMFMYSGVCTVSEDNIEALLQVDHVLQVSGLARYCELFMNDNLSPYTAVKYLNFAVSKGNQNAIREMLAYIKDNMKAILETCTIENLSESAMVNHLAKQNHSGQEELYFRCVAQWAGHHLFTNFDVLFEDVRFESFTVSFLCDVVLNNAALKQSVHYKRALRAVKRNSISS